MTFRKAIILVFLILFINQISNGQDCNYTVEGSIMDRATGSALSFGTVQIKGTDKGAVADENGDFIIHGICKEEFDLVFSYLGYKTIEHHHDIYHDLPKIYLAPQEVILKSVVVESAHITGDFSSATISSLSPEAIDQANSSTFGDLTSAISGVNLVKSGQNVVKPAIHGLHSNRILIINNGVRHEFQNWGSEHAPEIDPALLDKIKVIKGAATVRYGPDALGGVILIDAPELSLLEDLNGQLNLTTRSNGKAFGGNMEVKKGFHKLAFMAQASFLQQGDLHAPNYLLSNTGRKENSFTFGARYHLTNIDLNLYFSHFDQELGILRASVTGNLDDLVNAIEREEPSDQSPFSYRINTPKQRVQHELVKLKGRWHHGQQSVDVQYAFQYNHRQEFDVRRGTNDEIPTINLALFSHSLDLDYKHKPIGKWTGGMGVQALYQDNNNLPGTNTVPFVPNYDNFRSGIYLIENRLLSKNAELEFGARFDYQYARAIGRKPNNDIYRNTVDFKNFTASIGYLKEFGGGKSFRSNIGTAWRPPSISELYSFGRHQSSIDYGLWRFSINEDNEIVTGEILNQNEKAIASEKGLKWVNTYGWLTQKLDAEAVVYVNYIGDYIYSRPGGITNTVRGAFPYFLFEQTDALFLGADISAKIMHNSSLYSQLGGNYIWAKDIANSSDLPSISPPSLVYSLHYKPKNYWKFTNIKVGLSIAHTFEQMQHPRIIEVRDLLEAKINGEDLFATDRSTFDFLNPPESYTLVNTYVSTDLKPFNFSLKANNLFNSSYRSYTDRMRYFADDMGFNLELNINYSF